MIREATKADLPDLMAMGARFHAASGLPGKYDEEACAAFVGALMDAPAGVVFRSDAGLIMGMISPGYCTPDWRMAVELAWWSEDGAGRALLSRFEEWARDNGANEMRLTSIAGLNDRRMARLFGMAGYSPAEISYRKVL